ncbi:stage II sporulation protein SpoIID [Megasphaera cerevisiae DSM 20462]|jgi:stage II sporulation protein D|uniref:Stage II sporulation protein SpoIID n=1 Tax=Megasphaera cerevisiae DSM 20462 TaxID=1122219 RepID=A0A0J6WVD5_9FIRM|nr:SpoIID/LytB domain-containing protein [Megasphaera cerevisiae]KMO85777.1 stage II sporulation protein SpoIID [Megasphaera cerevisiae DSM 20462]MCI1751006.1 SpoIID/LytB domain-containing protein [Megasphaera cerevisiae]SKA10141.1 stage II sporulation protein D [Megasphaera cerevisiae DSM 20462]
MWKKSIRCFAIAAVVCICMTVSVLASGPGQEVRIGIREGRSAVSIMGPQGVGVYKNDVLWKKIPANTPVYVALKNGSLAVNGSVCAGTVSIRPLQSGGAVKVTDGYTYRGYLECIKSVNKWGLTVVNVVPLEQYLYGVVGKEMSPSWNSEALKAQAVAARTYAVSHKRYFNSRGFDMTDDTNSQIYAGMDGESPSVINAVDATNGEILTYKDKPIDAFFCASAGGWTENSENVWGNSVAYLRGVADASDKMPAYRWSVVTTPEKMAANLTAAGKSVGKIKTIAVSPLTRRPMAVSDRGVSGRVLTLTITGTKGQVRMTGNAFQAVFGLRSTLFDFYQGKGAVPDPDRTGKADRKQILTIKEGQPVTIFGLGWGHGLGMSQYGAYQMAQENAGTKGYYRKILAHYYTGTRLERLY